MAAAVDDARRRAKRLADLNGRASSAPSSSIQDQGGTSAAENRGSSTTTAGPTTGNAAGHQGGVVDGADRDPEHGQGVRPVRDRAGHPAAGSGEGVRYRGSERHRRSERPHVDRPARPASVGRVSVGETCSEASCAHEEQPLCPHPVGRVGRRRGGGDRVGSTRAGGRRPLPQAPQRRRPGVDQTRASTTWPSTQNDDGFWNNAQDGQAYPTCMASLAGMAFLAHGDTPSRGPYAANVRKVELYLLGNCPQQRPDHLGRQEEQSRSRCTATASRCCSWPASTAWRPTPRLRDQIKKAVAGAIGLTCPRPERRRRLDLHSRRGRRGVGHRHADAGAAGGPERRLQRAQGDGGQRREVTWRSAGRARAASSTASAAAGGPRLAISAAAVATLYNAGDYDSKLADDCLAFVVKRVRAVQGPVEQGDGPRVLPAPVRRPGVLPGRRQVLGRLLPRRPATS